MGLLYQTRTIAALSTAQAQGSAPVLQYNPKRVGLKIMPVADLTLTLAASETDGLLMFGGIANALVDQECPTNELYVRGASPGQKLVLWEAEEGRW